MEHLAKLAGKRGCCKRGECIHRQAAKVVADLDELQTIVDAALQWRSAELGYAASRLGIRQGNLKALEDRKLKRTADLQIKLDAYHRSMPEAAKAKE